MDDIVFQELDATKRYIAEQLLNPATQHLMYVVPKLLVRISILDHGVRVQEEFWSENEDAIRETVLEQLQGGFSEGQGVASDTEITFYWLIV